MDGMTDEEMARLLIEAEQSKRLLADILLQCCNAPLNAMVTALVGAMANAYGQFSDADGTERVAEVLADLSAMMLADVAAARAGGIAFAPMSPASEEHRRKLGLMLISNPLIDSLPAAPGTH